MSEPLIITIPHKLGKEEALRRVKPALGKASASFPVLKVEEEVWSDDRLDFGGFMGLGHSHYPIPWGALKYDPKLNGYVTGISEKQLQDAPAFSDDSWSDRNWEQQTYRHYNVTPYWA